MAKHPQAYAEEILRALAAAAGAVRLYPPTSDLPTQAIARSVEAVQTATASLGPVRFTVEPQTFKFGDTELGAGNAQVGGLAEALHARQVGQLVTLPGLRAEEVRAFLEKLDAEPYALNAEGGMRQALADANVTHLIVVEVSLRASAEEGLLGLDLLAAPPADLAPALVEAVDTWASGAGPDTVGEALDRLGPASGYAAERLAEALMRVDEATRVRLAREALETGPQVPMAGMREILANMPPATLARLLKLALGGDDAAKKAAADLELPPDVAGLLAELLKPSPRAESDLGVPPEADVQGMAEAVNADAEVEEVLIARQVASATPAARAGRAVRTTLAIAQQKNDEESVVEVGHALAQAASAGAYAEVRDALVYLDGLTHDVVLAPVAVQARAGLADPELLTAACHALGEGLDAVTLAEVLSAAGATGANTLISCYLQADDNHRAALARVARGMSEAVMSATGRELRSADRATALSLVSLLSALGDKRALPSLQQALDHLDAAVRRATVTALAEMPGPEARALLVKALGHWDVETRRFAIREVGRVHADEALPALVRVLEDINPIERNYELKKEVVKSLEALGSPTALPILTRIAQRRFMYGRKRRELQFLARGAVQRLSRQEGAT